MWSATFFLFLRALTQALTKQCVYRLLLLAACASFFPQAAQARVLVGFGTDKPPYIFEAGKSGLDVELVTAAFRAAGIAIEPFFAPVARLHSMMEQRRIDAITSTRESSGVSADYSDIYIVYHNYAITLASRKDIEIKRIEDLSKYHVTAFQRAQYLLGQRFHDAVAKSPGYTEQALQETRNLLLFSGRVDVAVGDKRIFEHYRPKAAMQVDSTQPVIYHDIFLPSQYKVGFHDATLRDRFNSGLATIRKNGVYESLIRKYGPYPDSH